MVRADWARAGGRGLSLVACLRRCHLRAAFWAAYARSISTWLLQSAMEDEPWIWSREAS